VSDVRDLAEFHVWPLARPAGAPARLFADPIAQSFALILATSFFFLVVPNVDLWFSGLFYQPGYGFPFGRLPASMGLRAVGNDLTAVAAVGLVVALLVKLALPMMPSLVAPRDALFILGTLLVGPGLIVNLIFKDHWGRPRPVMLEAFSSAQPFVGAWHMSDACTSNCSFVSGEASSAIWLVTLIVLLPPRWRATAVKVLIGLAIALSLNRIAAGGHFLSDVLLAWWMTLAVITIAYRYLYLTPPAGLTNARLEAGLTGAGEAIRRLFTRPA
jgi:lipid A 4'-phosphatase